MNLKNLIVVIKEKNQLAINELPRKKIKTNNQDKCQTVRINIRSLIAKGQDKKQNSKK